MAQLLRSCFFGCLLFFGMAFSPSAQAGDSGRWIASVKNSDNVLFEAWYRVLADGQVAGFAVQRYSFDPKKRELVSVYYLRTNEKAGGVTEALKARSTDTLKPLGYQYTSSVKGKTKTIDATFKGDQFIATIQEGQQRRILDRKLPKGAFLSTFLIYVMLKNESGIKVGANYSYAALAEEDGNVYGDGEAFVKDTQPMIGHDAFRILNKFNRVQFISFVTAKGEVLGTKSPLLGIETEAVGSMAEATQGMTVDKRALSYLFGKLPEITSFNISKAEAAPPTKSEQLQKQDGPKPEKGADVPPGVGIHTKAKDAPPVDEPPQE